MIIAQYIAPFFDRYAPEVLLGAMRYADGRTGTLNYRRRGRTYLIYGDEDVKRAAALCAHVFGGRWHTVGTFP